MTIPANIDYVAIMRDLNLWGFGNHKIGSICGFSQGYVSHIQAGRYRDMTYQRAARLYNFWSDECDRRLVERMGVGGVENNQYVALTT